MIRLVPGLKSSQEYEEKLYRQLEECSLDGISCEWCTNKTMCMELYDVMPFLLSESDYKRYSRGFDGFKMTKGAMAYPALSGHHYPGSHQ